MHIKNAFLFSLYFLIASCAQKPMHSVTESTSPASSLPALKNLGDTIKEPNSFEIKNVELFDGEKIVKNARVVIKDGWIVRVCAGDEKPCSDNKTLSIDGAGRFLMPSLIDSEGHFSRPAEMLMDLTGKEEAVCGKDAHSQPITYKASINKIFSSFVDGDLFNEVDTHGLVLDNGRHPKKLGDRYAISQSANYEKHIRFGVTTVLDMSAYPWPAEYVKRSRGKWHELKNKEDEDLKKEFLIYADLYTSGMWAAPATLQFGYYGMDPVYNIKPEGPWSQRDIEAWVTRRVHENSDHIKVFYENWWGMPAPQIDARTLKALVKAAHAKGLKVFTHNTISSENVIDAKADVNIHTPGANDKELMSDDFAERFAKNVHFVTPTIAGFVMTCNNPYSMSNKINHALSNQKPGTNFISSYIDTPDVLPYINALDEIRLLNCTGPDKKPYRQPRVFQSVAKLYDHGAILTTGSDAEMLEPVIEGVGVHYETYLIREALNLYSKNAKGDDANLAALKAATSNAALTYGFHIEKGHHSKQDPRGFIKPGYRADLLLLRESPMKNILNTLKIERVWKAGFVANRQMIRPECASGDCRSTQIIRELEAKSCN